MVAIVPAWTGERAAKARAALRARRLPCWLCGQRIDYTLGKDSEDSFSLDHVKPRSTHPELTWEPTNHAAAHLRCNKARGAAIPAPALGATSEEW